MRFTLYIDTDRAPDGPTTWKHLIDLVRNEMARLEDHTDLLMEEKIRPMELHKIQSYDGYFTIGGYKVAETAYDKGKK